MLQEEAGDLGLDAYVPDLQKIHAAGSQLLALINDNISHTRVESGKLDLDSMQRDSRSLLHLIIGYSELCQEDAAEGDQRAAAVLRDGLAVRWSRRLRVHHDVPHHQRTRQRSDRRLAHVGRQPRP